MIERQVDADAKQPRPETATGVELVQSLKGSQECFLGEIPGQFLFVDKSQNDAN